jgi:hypothetical protein
MYTSKLRLNPLLLFIIVILVLCNLVGCEPSAESLEAVDYTPLPGDDWQVSTPVQQGLKPDLVAHLYLNGPTSRPSMPCWL